MPEISVIIPTLNRPKETRRAVDSVLSQKGVAFELLVIDDGSSEPDLVLQEFVEAAGHRYLRQDNAGVAAARNRGVRESSAPWLSFLDSDDVWMPNKLRTQFEFHQHHPSIAISQTAEVWFRKGRRVNPKFRHAKPEGEFFERALELCCVSPSAVMLTRSLFDRCGGFDQRFTVCEDYDLWLRIAVEHQIGLIDQELVIKYGGHADQLSHSQLAMDRYRICSMLKLASSTELELSRQSLLRHYLQSKVEVLLSGAKKRDNYEFANVLEEIRSSSAQDIAQWHFDEETSRRLLAPLPR